MIRKTYRKFAVIMLASVMMCSSVCAGQETGNIMQAADEGSPQEPETQPPQPETQPPQPETQPPQPETPAPQTEPPAPQTEAPVQTEAPAPQTETSAPETASGSDNGSETQNHSTAIPKDPTEKKLKQDIVDAHEDEEGFSVSINGGESVVIEPDKNFRTVVDAITGGSFGYKMDYVRPGTGLREPIEIEEDGTIKSIFAKVNTMPGTACDIVLYINNGNSLWLNMKVQGTLEDNDAEIVFKSMSDVKPCTVSYDANGGSLTDSISIVRRKGEWYSHFDMKASKDGESFCGWFDGPGDDAKRIFPTDTVEKDITLYAHYCSYGVQVVAFDFGFSTAGDNGSLIHHLIFPKKEDGTYDVADYPVFEHDGKAIGGWIDEAGNPAGLTGMSGDRTLRADWKDPSEIQPKEPEAGTVTETEAAAEEG